MPVSVGGVGVGETGGFWDLEGRLDGVGWTVGAEESPVPPGGATVTVFCTTIVVKGFLGSSSSPPRSPKRSETKSSKIPFLLPPV